jgi:hypothetical protein
LSSSSGFISGQSSLQSRAEPAQTLQKGKRTNCRNKKSPKMPSLFENKPCNWHRIGTELSQHSLDCLRRSFFGGDAKQVGIHVQRDDGRAMPKPLAQLTLRALICSKLGDRVFPPIFLEWCPLRWEPRALNDCFGSGEAPMAEVMLPPAKRGWSNDQTRPALSREE